MARKLADNENTEQGSSPVDKLEGKVSLNRRQYVLMGTVAAGGLIGTGFVSSGSSSENGQVEYMTNFEEYSQ